MSPTPFTELGPKKNPKADFAMKQTNTCRLSGDIIMLITCMYVSIPSAYIVWLKGLCFWSDCASVHENITNIVVTIP